MELSSSALRQRLYSSAVPANQATQDSTRAVKQMKKARRHASVAAALPAAFELVLPSWEDFAAGVAPPADETERMSSHVSPAGTLAAALLSDALRVSSRLWSLS